MSDWPPRIPLCLRERPHQRHHERTIMTTSYSIDVAEYTHRDGAAPERTSIALASTPDPVIAAALLRAAANRLDPPKPAYRSAADRREAADQRFREKLAGYGDQATGNAYDARCRGSDCAEGHTYLAGCALWPALTLDDAGRERMAEDRRTVQARDTQGLPNYAHDADCNTTHDAGPEPCPPPRTRRPGRTVETDLDRAAKNDGCGPTHTHTGSCAYTVVERINPNV